jgi:hypothetical protein
MRHDLQEYISASHNLESSCHHTNTKKVWHKLQNLQTFRISNHFIFDVLSHYA